LTGAQTCARAPHCTREQLGIVGIGAQWAWGPWGTHGTGHDQGTRHWALCTGHWALGTGHSALGARHRAPRTGHRPIGHGSAPRAACVRWPRSAGARHGRRSGLRWRAVRAVESVRGQVPCAARRPARRCEGPELQLRAPARTGCRQYSKEDTATRLASATRQ